MSVTNKEDIYITVTDSKIWNRDDVILKLMLALQHKKEAVLHLSNVSGDYEGPCAATLGLYTILDHIGKLIPVDKTKITIRTQNQIECHEEYNIEIVPVPSNRNGGLYNRHKSGIFKNFEKTFDEKFKHFGCFIARSNWQRLWIASHLYSKHKDKTLLTFHYKVGDDFHLNHLGYDELLALASEHKVSPYQVGALIDNAPLHLENARTAQGYPIVSPEAVAKIVPYHRNFFADIACETFFSGNTFTFTEKTRRNLLVKTPFLIQGPVDWIKNFRNLGFKTFDTWWPEYYNSANALPKSQELTWSTFELLKVVDNLSKLSLEQLQAMYIDMKDTLEYNYNRYIEYAMTESSSIEK